MAHRSPAFQFYPADWLSSPNITVMTPAEEGAYIRLLCYCWSDPDCSIPDDDETLARLSRLNEQWLKGSSTVVRLNFTTLPSRPGRLYNVRLAQERIKQDRWRLKCSKGGKQSGKSRAYKAKQKGSVDEGYLKGSSTVVELNGNSSSSSLSLSLIKETTMCVDDEFEQFWKAYPRKAGGKKNAHRAWIKAKDRPSLDIILSAIEKAKQSEQWKKDNGQFIPYPATWLNQGRWADETPPQPPKKRIILT